MWTISRVSRSCFLDGLPVICAFHVRHEGHRSYLPYAFPVFSTPAARANASTICCSASTTSTVQLAALSGCTRYAVALPPSTNQSLFESAPILFAKP